MTRFWLIVLVGLASYAVVNTLCSALAMLVWRMRARYPHSPRALLPLALAPTALAAASTLGIVLPTFVLLEPAAADEVVGAWFGVAALAGTLLVGGALLRGCRASLSTRRLESLWRAQARPWTRTTAGLPVLVFESPWPIAAIVGSCQPRIYIASRILDVCDPDEVRAIVAHEQAHAAARDNLVLHLLRALPDVLSLTATGRHLHQAWQRHAEARADDRSTARQLRQRLALASALIKVAKVSVPQGRVALPGPALLDGDDVARRIERLVAPAAGAEPEWAIWGVLAAAAIVFPILTFATGIHLAVFAAIEAFVRL